MYLSNIANDISCKNSCDKNVFRIDDISQVKRFLILGSESGTYYVAARDLTGLNIACLDRLLETDKRCLLLDIIRDLENNNRCKNKDTIIYALAACCTLHLNSHLNSKESIEFRKKAYVLMREICRIPTHLFLFIHFCKSISQIKNNSTGWNNIHKKAITEWYNDKKPRDLVFLTTKYKNRSDYSHRDIFRLCHIKATSDLQNDLYYWIVNGECEFNNLKEDKVGLEILNWINDYQTIQNMSNTPESIDKAVILIKRNKFVREHVPTGLLGNKIIWTALLSEMPILAVLRNLNKMTSIGVFEEGKNINTVINLLGNDIARKKAKIHPMQVLITLKMYSKGCGDLGKLTWQPVTEIVDFLDRLFYKMFDSVEPTGKKILVSLDVSGSMTYNSCTGSSCIMPLEVGSAMAMIWKNNEKFVDIMAFSHDFIPLNISPRRRLDDNLNSMRNMPFGSTDISRPFTWALQNRKEYDAFIVITDNETNSNAINPIVALKNYRQEMQLPTAKLVVLATTAADFSVADPNDSNCLDCCGFDATVPDIINDFIKSPTQQIK